MLELLNEIDSFVWGPPLLVLLVGTGIWLTLRLNLLQVLKLPMALKLIFSAKNDGDGDVNSFKALCTALAATVGTGNIGFGDQGKTSAAISNSANMYYNSVRRNFV